MKYIKVKIKASNVSMFNTEFIYGLPSPLAYHSLLSKIRLDSRIEIEQGFTITYKTVNTSKTKRSYILKARDLSTKIKRSEGIEDNPRAYIEVYLIFRVSNFSEDTEERLKKEFLKNRIAKGMIDSVEIKSEENVKKLKPFGFTQCIKKTELSDEDYFLEFVLGGSISGRRSGLINQTVVGRCIIGDIPKEYKTRFDKKGFWSTSVFRMTELRFIRNFDEGEFERNSWYTYKTPGVFAITTKSGGEVDFIPRNR